jgi:nucleoid-associated protein YgaU
MTRETKIGLLVGLAFIIVIGILLSDHMTSTNDPTKAALSVAGGNVRESVAAPAGQGGASAGPSAVPAAASVPQVSAPAQPVLTQHEVAAPPRPAVQNIQVGPAAGASQAQTPSPITIQQTAQGAPPAQLPGQITQVPPAAGAGTEPPVTFVPPGQAQRAAVHPIQGLAAKYGEVVVVFGEAGASQRAGSPVPMAPLREYKAQPGDSLSKLASKYLGSASKANREAIVRANPSLQQNPDKIVAGRTYFLPAPVTPTAPDAAAGPATPQAADGAGPSTPVAAAPAPSPAPVPDNFTWYTVKENDNLWKIAAEQLGSGNAWTQIRDLNQDVLKGQDRLSPNMRIKLPKQQPVASAS